MPSVKQPSPNRAHKQTISFRPSALALAAGLHSEVSDLFSLTAVELALRLVQSAVGTGGGAPTGVWLLTSGGQPLVGVLGAVARPERASAWGLARSARQEARAACIGCIEVREQQAEWWRLVAAQSSPQGTPLELDYACSVSLTHVSRLTSASSPIVGPVRLHLHGRGAMTNLSIEAQLTVAEGTALAEGEAEVRVRAVGLNFRDVLNVLGEYPGDPGPPGGDCAGTVAGVGAGVKHLVPGEGHAFGYAHSPLASTARGHALLLAHTTAALAFEAACTLPTVWSTVCAALASSELHGVQQLLVHAAVGGVGLAAIESAHWLRGVVDATASRPHKHARLRSGLGVVRSCSSRDVAAFGWGAAQLEQGVRSHGALSSLSADFICASLVLLGESGAFSEIGKRGVWSAVRQSAACGVACHTIALDADMALSPEWMQRVLTRLVGRAASGVVHGLPLQSFDLVTAYEAAFRSLQAGSNTGKVVLRVAQIEGGRGEGSHVLTGGTGGLGLLTARWLAHGGARRVLLASRGGALPAFADGTPGAKELALLHASGVWVQLERCDTAEPLEALRLLARARLTDGAAGCGVWHAAGVLADGTLAQQSA